jgi:predicted phage terminase large subunit-like protein
LTTPQVDRALLLKELSMRKAANDNFYIFGKYLVPEHQLNWHHKVLADKLQDFSEGHIKNLMVFLPPQTGKSQWSSRYFPAYHLGKNPDAKMILGAYNITFASKFNRDVQRIITGDRYKNVFPDTRLSAKNTVTDANRNYLKNAHIFEVVDHNGYFTTAGIGTGLTGITADIGIIDDPIKDKVEAMSEVYRERLWDWYNTVFKTRLHNDSQQLITLTRWHENDLAGRILEQEGDKWEVVILPAINVDGPSDIDPRQVGEVLWPKRHSLERMQEIDENEPDTFLSLYQQRPTKKGGNIIKESDFQIVNLFELPAGLFDQRVDMTADTAYTAKTDNDPSGLMAYSVFENYLYIWDWSIVRKEFSELVDFVYLYREMHGSNASKVFVEPKASGKSVAQYLRKKTNLNVIEYEMQEGDKTARLYSVEPYISSGRVILVAGKWNKPFIKQVCAFPKDTHDEAVDNLVMAITQGLVRGQRKRGGRKAAIINN